MGDDAAFPGGEAEIRVYRPGECAPFRRLTDALGALSNMAPGFPLVVNGLTIGSSEALYQCMRFPHLPDVQRLVIAAPSPLAAKEACAPRREQSRADWTEVRVEVMRWCLRVKLAQHRGVLGSVLVCSGELPIVEVSARDVFWGAKPREDGAFVGANVLGRLWTAVRGEHCAGDGIGAAPPPGIQGCLLLRERIGTVPAPSLR